MVASSQGENGTDGVNVYFIWFSYNNTNTIEHICMHVDTLEMQY
jgi:hypothetical protein